MDYEAIVAHFGGVTAAKKALGLKSRQTLYNWRDQGVPGPEQCRIQLLTEGKLTADEEAVRGNAAAPGEPEREAA